MRFRQSPEDKEGEAITRLVDEPATGAQPAQSSEWADRPEIRRQVVRQRRVADELRSGGPAVPDQLVRNIDAKVRKAYGSAAPRPRRNRLGSGSAWRPAIAAHTTATPPTAIAGRHAEPEPRRFRRGRGAAEP